MNCINFFLKTDFLSSVYSPTKRKTWCEVALIVSGVILVCLGTCIGTAGLFAPVSFFPSFLNHALGTIGYEGSIGFIASFGAVGIAAIAIGAFRLKKKKRWSVIKKAIEDAKKSENKKTIISQADPIIPSQEPRKESSKNMPFRYIAAKTYIRRLTSSELKLYVKIDDENCYILEGGEVKNQSFLEENKCKKAEITYTTAEIFSKIENQKILKPNTYCFYPYKVGKLTRYVCIIQNEGKLEVKGEALKEEEIADHRRLYLRGLSEIPVESTI
jgi:hypothetical protein